MSEPNPFITLEAIHEHISSAWVELARLRGLEPREHRRQEWPLGTPEYHLQAAEEGTSRLLQRLILLLPGIYNLAEGEVSDPIIDQIEDAGE